MNTQLLTLGNVCNASVIVERFEPKLECANKVEQNSIILNLMNIRSRVFQLSHAHIRSEMAKLITDFLLRTPKLGQ
jgi:hypothetical protein